MPDTLLIWYNPDAVKYETGPYACFKSLSGESINEDRFEVLYEFNVETVFVADKILNSLNAARASSLILNL
ncbi:MAG: hypothetical protein RLN88_11925 [Ekhidna sp.]|uniref:hypothetical protein n=1 Tax=Ekhidna sp. TaxID=2608089 RepID=UPI0032EEBF7A